MVQNHFGCDHLPVLEDEWVVGQEEVEEEGGGGGQEVAEEGGVG